MKTTRSQLLTLMSVLLAGSSAFAQFGGPPPLQKGDVDRLLSTARNKKETAPNRLKAMQELRRTGVEKDTVAADLENLVSDGTEDHNVREAAAATLGIFGMARSVKALTLSMQDDNRQLRRESIVALTRIQPEGVQAVGQRFREGSDDERAAVIFILDGDSIEGIKEQFKALLKDSSPKVRAAAIQGYMKSERGGGGLVVVFESTRFETIYPLVKDEDKSVRDAAITTLLRISLVPSYPDHKAKILALLAEKDPALRKIGLNYLRTSATGVENYSDILVNLASTDPDNDVQQVAEQLASTLGNGAGNKLVFARYIRDLSDLKAPEGRRAEALLALIDMHAIPREFLPALIISIDDKINYGEVLGLLGQMGSDAKAALPALEKAREAAPAANRAIFTKTIALIGPSQKVDIESLIGKLADPQENIRRNAIDSLGAAGMAAAPSIGPLAKVAHDDKMLRPAAVAAMELIEDSMAASYGQGSLDILPAISRVNLPAIRQVQAAFASNKMEDRHMATIALERARPPEIKQFEKELEAALHDPHRTVRAGALVAISRLGIQASDMVPKIIPLLKDWADEPRYQARQTLVAINPKDAVLVTAELELLADTDGRTRSEAASMLSQAGSAAKPALPRLRDLLKNESDAKVKAVYQHAISAIEKAGN